MGKKKTLKLLKIILTALACLSAASISAADTNWRIRADADLAQSGMVEAVLPAGLFFSSQNEKHLDLKLLGPDGRPRAFELYWKENRRSVSRQVTPEQIRLGGERELIWVGPGFENILADKIRIHTNGPDTVGSVTVEGRTADGWQELAQNAALYRTDGRIGAEINLPPDIYLSWRLTFKGYDARFQDTPLLVDNVLVFGETIGKDYATQDISLEFQDRESEDTRVITALLPGTGLWLEKITLHTAAQFQGQWEIGFEGVRAGTRAFTNLQSGEVSGVSRHGTELIIRPQIAWPDRKLMLKLQTQGRFIGPVQSLAIEVRLPRIAFYADQPGTYSLQAGGGQSVPILSEPGDTKRRIDLFPTFGQADFNPEWQPQSLVDEYAIRGGPFIAKGYTWQSRLVIPEPGFYKLQLDAQAALAPDRKALRLVLNETQVPYFYGQSRDEAISLEFEAEYDAKENSTIWQVSLPRASAHWQSLRLSAKGVFQRRVTLEIQKPGNLGWQPWVQKDWQNRRNQSAELTFDLRRFPPGQNLLRISMDHGDNQPLALSKIEAIYDAPVLLFLAQSAGAYTLMGGNPDAAAPTYDLALVKAHLMDVQPREARMTPIESMGTSFWQIDMERFFSGRGWGLYGVLGLVTLVLIILIVRLFPKAGQETED